MEGPIRFVVTVSIVIRAFRASAVAAVMAATITPLIAQAPPPAPPVSPIRALPGDPVSVPSAPPAPKPPAPARPPAWIASVGLGYALTSGNADTSTLNVSFDISSRPQQANVFKADLLYLRGKENGRLSLNRLSLRARDEYTRAKGRTYLFGQIEGLRDTFRDIDYLAAPSFGVGHKVRDTPALTLFLDAGLGLKVEKNRGRDVLSTGAVTASQRFSHRLSEHASISQSLAGLWTIDRLDDALYTFKAGLTADLTRRSQIKLEIVDLYRTRTPAVTVEQNDVSFVTSVVYKF